MDSAGRVSELLGGNPALPTPGVVPDAQSNSAASCQHPDKGADRVRIHAKRTAQTEPGDVAALTLALRSYICMSREGWDLLVVPLVGAKRSADVPDDASLGHTESVGNPQKRYFDRRRNKRVHGRSHKGSTTSISTARDS